MRWRFALVGDALTAGALFSIVGSVLGLYLGGLGGAKLGVLLGLLPSVALGMDRWVSAHRKIDRPKAPASAPAFEAVLPVSEADYWGDLAEFVHKAYRWWGLGRRRWLGRWLSSGNRVTRTYYDRMLEELIRLGIVARGGGGYGHRFLVSEDEALEIIRAKRAGRAGPGNMPGRFVVWSASRVGQIFKGGGAYEVENSYRGSFA